MRTLLPPFALSALTGCGLEHLGVLSVHVTLEPTAPSDVPAELAGLINPESAHEASGTAEADIPGQTLTVNATSLPDPPQGWVWVPILHVEHDERAGLPGVHHGHSDTGEGSPAVMEPLSRVGTEEWAAIHIGRRFEGAPLGGLRAARVMLMRENLMMEGPTWPVLEGEASFEREEGGASPEDEDGHTHGV